MIMQVVETEAQAAVMDAVPQFYDDPLGFVLYVFPWGEEGSGLEDKWPDVWQQDVLNTIAAELKKRNGMPLELRTAIQIAVASGHGIGKTALVAWIIMWFIATRPNPAIIVTANTFNQLSTKTWRELSKWHNISIIKPWFEWTATSYFLKEERERWFASAVPWSEHNSEAFAGTHERYVLIIFDEASAVADSIWEVVEGALTGEEALWICFGNPTKNTGRFRECFRKFVARWITRNIDSRTAAQTNKAKIQEWLEDWGEDSDFFKVRVRGQFPNQSADQLMPDALVNGAMNRDPAGWEWEPVIIGLDVAWKGDDQSAVCVRQGTKVHELTYYRIADTMELADKVLEVVEYYRRPDRPEPVVFVDVTGGLGAGPYNAIKRLRRGYTFPVDFGANAREKLRYFNKRTEMWFAIRDWLKHGGLPKDPLLLEDLTNIEYYHAKESKLRLESKDDLKKRIDRSPDGGDALAITFAYPVRAVATSGAAGAGYADTVRAQLGYSASRAGVQQQQRSPLRTMQRFRKG